MLTRIIIFIVLNFGALALGGLFTGKGVPSAWYQNLDKAPWTPPGWVFGSAWFTIMFCFTFFMVFLWEKSENKSLLIVLFSLQWLLNVGWNPAFFQFHAVLTGLIIISLLTVLVAYLFYYSWPIIRLKSLLIAPYLIWLTIATSLNAYIWLKN